MLCNPQRCWHLSLGRTGLLLLPQPPGLGFVGPRKTGIRRACAGSARRCTAHRAVLDKTLFLGRVGCSSGSRTMALFP
jgi:hypothetical protein